MRRWTWTRGARRALAAGVACSALLLALAQQAQAATSVRFGLQDDAWLLAGPGTMAQRVAELRSLGVELVRVNLRWDAVATAAPAAPRDPDDPAYDWSSVAGLLEELRAAGLDAVVTILGTPAFANGGAGWNVAPSGPGFMRDFAEAAASRFPWVRHWLVWNEPNQRKWLRPTSAAVYVTRLLNPAHAGIKAASPRALVAGGVTAPRGGEGGRSPVQWIRGMRAAGARLDAYAHHPYPLFPRTETPWTGGCGHCQSITMATLEKLLRETRRAFGTRTRVWLTEYGYQSRPPDRILGVSYAKQARFLGEAAHRAYRGARVDMLIQFLYRDEPDVARWQSGLLRAGGAAKPARAAFRFPLAQVSRRADRTKVFGQIRPRVGRQTYRLQVRRGGRWVNAGGVARTGSSGFFTRTIVARRGAKVRLYSPADRAAGPALTIR